ncbi:MAG TPA: copper chaperone PCu(A)C [Burkholderiaceae bacterium]|nr:copper chaperone PCu(A)C [Burkholderiaceae bacterium]
MQTKLQHIALAIGILAGSTLAQAHDQVTIKDPWVRGTVAQQKATGAFMQISSDKEVRLIEAKAPAAIAGVVEIHEMAMDKDVMKMRQIKGLDIVPGKAAELKPGGYHVMLMDLKQQLKAGDTVPLTLTFEDSKTKARFSQEVKAPVNALGAGTTPMSGAGAMPAAGKSEHKH